MTSEEKLTILFLAANPVDTNRLQLDEEVRAVDEALRKGKFRDRFDLRSHWAVRYGDLQELFLDLQPHVVHFSGHGSPAGEIVLKGNDGAGRTVPANALAGLFEILKDNVRCIVLNACYSEAQAHGIAQHIDCVVGMSRAITDAAAVEFASAFYLGLGHGRSVKTAFELGCNRIDLAGLDEKDTPQLLALRVDPATIVLAGAASGKVTGAPVSGSGKLTRLTGLQGAVLHRALLSAFDLGSLQQMVTFQLNQNLAAIAGGTNFSDVVFALTGWAERSGKLDDLLDGALAAVPGNPELQRVVKMLRTR